METFMRGLRGEGVVVTGGGGGIGAATCQRFAEEGAKVAVFDINGDAAKRAAAQITAAGGRAEAFACDITNYAGCQSAVRGAEVALGPVDVLVKHAGWGVFKTFTDNRPAECQ